MAQAKLTASEIKDKLHAVGAVAYCLHEGQLYLGHSATGELLELLIKMVATVGKSQDMVMHYWRPLDGRATELTWCSTGQVGAFDDWGWLLPSGMPWQP